MDKLQRPPRTTHLLFGRCHDPVDETRCRVIRVLVAVKVGQTSANHVPGVVAVAHGASDTGIVLLQCTTSNEGKLLVI